MDRVLQQRKATERDLRRALAENALVLHYQPQRDLRTGALTGAEALARWTHPERGPVSPAEFIAVAEQSGLIAQLGAWALRSACQEAALWPAGLSVAVNLSPVQLRASDMVDQVRAALAQSGLEPGRLELEITEGVMLRDTTTVLATLRGFRDLGVRVALDDFGTGYSSLSYLRRMPIDKIKIDQSFVRALGQEPSALALVRSILSIAQGLGIRSIAEGVETQDQALKLLADGCQEAQGWFFGRPVAAQAFRALCQSHAIQDWAPPDPARARPALRYAGLAAEPASKPPSMVNSEPVM
jgi:EAL domain-containing protein (putative c-di-GMP-specific phosphodiesterase class I)